MAYIYDLADTWNASGTTFTAVKMNVTDTASAAASLLMDLQVGGSSKFSVTKAGAITSVSTLAMGGGTLAITSVNAVLWGSGLYGWISGNASPTSTPDLALARDAANTLAQRNGVNAQAFNLYNSYTDVSNYSRLVMYADGSANYYIGTQKAGTGSSASLFVGTGAGSTVGPRGKVL